MGWSAGFSLMEAGGDVMLASGWHARSGFEPRMDANDRVKMVGFVDNLASRRAAEPQRKLIESSV